MARRKSRAPTFIFFFGLNIILTRLLRPGTHAFPIEDGVVRMTAPPDAIHDEFRNRTLAFDRGSEIVGISAENDALANNYVVASSCPTSGTSICKD